MTEFMVYKCRVCGNVALMLVDGGVVPVCCSQDMELLDAGTVDASREKHVPAVTREGDRVEVVVGTDLHPMLPEHYIAFIALQCVDCGKVKIQHLKPGEEPRASFLACGDGPVRIFEYCNLHDLWMTEA